MKDFQLHDIETAPEDSQPLLKGSIKAFGIIPNLHAVMAQSPAVLEAYQQLHALAQKSSFDKEQLTVVWQTINVEHNCKYCVPAHTMIAGSMNVSGEISDALRDESELPTTELNVLRDTTLAIVRNRGIVSDSELATFYEAGFTKQQLLEIVLVLSQKVMSNYINHLADTPLDKPFQEFEWSKKTSSLTS